MGVESGAILWLGGVFPSDEWGRAATSPAAQRWQTEMISALERKGSEVVCVGHAPQRVFPFGGPLVDYVGVTYASRHRPSTIRCPYLNLPYLRHVCLIFAYTVISILATRHNKFVPALVVTYNIYAYCTAAACVVSHLRGIDWYAVLADFPASAIDRCAVSLAETRIDGVLGLSMHLLGRIDAPSMLIPGGVHEPQGLPNYGTTSAHNTVVGVYVGSLHPDAGIGVLARSLQYVTAQDLEIAVVGHGPLEWLERVLGADPRVRIYGFLGEAELSEVMASADFFLAPREPRTVYSLGTFPSKVLTYLAHERPILASPEGLPKDMARCFTVVEGGDHAWAGAIDRQVLSSLSEGGTSQAPCFAKLRETYSWDSQAERVLQFVGRQ